MQLNNKMKLATLIFVISFYFLVTWLTPWQTIAPLSSISVSYLFDLLFVVIISLLFKFRPVLFIQDSRSFIIKLFFAILFAFSCIVVTNILNLKAPFRFIENLFLQLVILAPIVEEIVFRYLFLNLSLWGNLKEKHILIINSSLFSLSHLAALWVIPSEFVGFICFQVIYTFALGWICTRALLKNKSILAPVMIHLVFNLVFYIAIVKQVI